MQIPAELYQRLVAAKQFIDQNYEHHIGLDKISQRAFLSPFHFHRLFRKVYRRTPHQYLTRKRIEKAKDLLEQDKTLLDVCSQVGFESIGTFSSLFKKEIGMAPAYFRRVAQVRRQAVKAQPLKFVPHCFLERYKMMN
jgi:AraC-like DNA-binding protein